MRRPRHRLQVSTFPFLAVLLGAMGALIFLLLIMDRRAKIVARNKVRELTEQRLAQEEKLHQDRAAAWQQRQRELRALLDAEAAEVRAELDNVAVQLTGLRRRQEEAHKLDEHMTAALAKERSLLEETKQRVQARHSELLRSSDLSETTRAELARLTRELLELEQAVAAVKQAQQQQRPTYSLVPYRGSRGQRRVPLYVECTRLGLTFIPERTLFTGEFDVVAFRQEVEKRHGPLSKQQRDADPFRSPEIDKPYVLFLIRPDGVSSYYQAQAALRGYQIDFGYELIDSDWELAVPTSAEVAAVLATEPTPSTGANGGPKQASSGKGPSAGSQARGSLGPAGPPNVSLGAPQPGLQSAKGGSPLPAGHPAGAKQAKGGVLEGQEHGQGAPAAADSNQQGTSNPPAGAAAADATQPGSHAGSAAFGAKQAGPAAVSRVVGNRDFVINIACYADGVVVTPGGAAFNWTEATDARALDDAFVRGVHQIISRRQATVRAGEPPYRVVLRFVVHPEGRRSLYRVYPLLEAFGLPMVRENVEE